MNQITKKALLFLFLVSGLYGCYLISAIFHQKILKKPYVHSQTRAQKIFDSALVFTIFPQLFAIIIGKICILFQKESVHIPWKKCLQCSLVINLCGLTYNEAVIYASFPAVVMAKSCSLLSVIIVGVFCSKVKDKNLKLTKDKIFIGILATIGILFFNFFKQNEDRISDNPISIFSLSSIFLLISLIGDGFLPDIQAQIKSQFKPSSIDMYFHVNKFVFLFGLLLSIVSMRITLIIEFILDYQGFARDLVIFSALNGIGQLFIYRMIKQFKQHIPAFAIAFRKCITVLINIIWFKHLVNWHQICGISLVFIAVIWEVYSNYQQAKSKQQDYQQQKNKKAQIDETQSILKSIDQQLSKLPQEQQQKK